MRPTPSIHHPISLLTLVATIGLVGACQSTDPEPLPAPDPVAQAVTSGPLSKRLGDEFSTHLSKAQGITYQDLLTQHRPDYLPQVDFEVKDAAHHDGFVSTFGLSAAAQSTLEKLGFVVVPPQPSPGKGPAEVFYQVFAADLPVFISADAILHAWHRTFDNILMWTEQMRLSKVLAQLLEQTQGALDASMEADRDALFYLAVARSLLDGSVPPPSVKAEVDLYLQLIAERGIAKVAFMGVNTDIDFSQFIPRGHYTRSEELEKYFMAMMWLGRTDLVLRDPNPAGEPRPREEAAARALAGAILRSGSVALFQQMDTFYAAFVGKTNALTPERLLQLCDQAGLAGCQGDPASMAAVYAQEPAPEYSSRVFADAVPPVSMRFFPQRFAYGAWVTSQTTTPRLKPAVIGGRAMAMPEDVAFALGSDRALEYYVEEMQLPNRENLPATLLASRQTMAAIRPAALEPTIFNHWLEGLMALSETSLAPELPQVMRTAAWHDRKLEAVLASWTELRHDTILIVEQSTGGVGCQYPRGYVEPVPELYQSLAQAADKMAQVFSGTETLFDNVAPCMEHWKDTLGRLKAMAEKELAGQPMSAEELAFLNQTADLHGTAYYGERMFDGWYPQLFWSLTWKVADPDNSEPDPFGEHPSGISEPLVADVHTDAENGLALEVATGHPGLMIVAVDNGGDISLYGGPASSYYSFSVPVSERMTDDAWQAKVDGGTLPQRPAFSQGYWVE